VHLSSPDYTKDVVLWTGGIAALGLGMLLTAAQVQERASTDEQVAEWFSAAQRAKAAGNLALAEGEYHKVIRARPDLAEARSNLGIVYYLQGRCDDALVQFRQALRVRPGLEVPLVFSGICHQKMHQYEQAIPLLEQALRARPTQSEIYLYLGLSYSGLGNEARANEWFEKFAGENPSDTEALYQLGGSYLQLSSKELDTAGADPFLFARTQAELGEAQNNPVAAVRARYEQAISLRPDYPNLHWRLARVLLRGEAVQAARSALAGELQVQPEHVPALLLAAEIDRQTEHAERGRELLALDTAVAAVPRNDNQFAAGLAKARNVTLGWLNSVIEMEEPREASASAIPGWPRMTDLSQTLDSLWKSMPSGVDNDWALDIYTRCRISRGELQLVRGQLESVIQAKPGWLMPRFLLGDVYRRLALGTFARMVELDPKGYQAMLIEAETLDSARRDEEAEKAYRAVLLARPEASGIHYRLCALLLRRRRLPEAIAECQRELASDAFHTQARVALAEAYLEQHQPEQALPLLRRAVEEDSRLASAFLALARAYRMLAQPAPAAAAFERALKIAPDDLGAHYQLAQTFQELGRDSEAEREFGVVRRLRARRRAPLRAPAEPSVVPH
jgi:tetratricopeptide (TPR) repeat protein